jgi:hypothetical protein
MEHPSQEAEDTWCSFIEMTNSKAFHLEKLLAVSNRKEKGKYPSLKEQRELANLLEKHDINVKEFAKKIRGLKQISAKEHEILIQKMVLYSQENLNP